MLDFNLTPEQIKLQQKARKFAKEEILPVAWYYDEIDETPVPVLKKAYDGGLINGEIPKKYGGKGWGLVDNVVMTEEFAAACPGLATSIFDNSLGMEPLLLSKNEPLKQKYLSKILNEFK
ncbi:MAG: acyl-CoA dehydrogenase family protein, partial [Desulfobacterales bacterium]